MDARSLVKEINRSKRRTMTKNTMTKALVYFAEGALVALAVVVAWGMLVITFSL